MGAAASLAGSAEGYVGDDRFLLPPLPRSADSAVDIATLTDGSVLVSDEASVTWLLAPGALSWRRVPRLQAVGMTPLPGNRLLAVDADDDRIVQWTEGAEPVAVAGTGEFGFSGDGGPGTSAQISPSSGSPHSRGIVALPGGGFLYGDTHNNRVRYLDAMGVIHTAAGNGREAPRRGGGIGDGGAAVSAVVRLPVALSLLPDGGYVVLEAGTNWRAVARAARESGGHHHHDRDRPRARVRGRPGVAA